MRGIAGCEGCSTPPEKEKITRGGHAFSRSALGGRVQPQERELLIHSPREGGKKKSEIKRIIPQHRKERATIYVAILSRGVKRKKLDRERTVYLYACREREISTEVC